MVDETTVLNGNHNGNCKVIDLLNRLRKAVTRFKKIWALLQLGSENHSSARN
jgi:hypothetical protein